MLTYPFVLVSNLMAVNNCGWVDLADYLLLWLLLSVRPNRVILPLSPQACWWPATLCISVSHLGGLLEASKQRGKSIRTPVPQTLEKCRCHEKHSVCRMQRVHHCQFCRQSPSHGSQHVIESSHNYFLNQFYQTRPGDKDRTSHFCHLFNELLPTLSTLVVIKNIQTCWDIKSNTRPKEYYYILPLGVTQKQLLLSGTYLEPMN